MEVNLKLDGDKRKYPFDTYTAELISTAIDSTFDNPTETGLYIQDLIEIVPCSSSLSTHGFGCAEMTGTWQMKCPRNSEGISKFDVNFYFSL